MKRRSDMDALRIDVAPVLDSDSTPSEDGERLASYLIENDLLGERIILDVTDVQPESLVSSFVNSLYHHLEDRGVALDDLRITKWIAAYAEEARRLEKLSALYRSNPRKALVGRRAASARGRAAKNR